MRAPRVAGRRMGGVRCPRGDCPLSADGCRCMCGAVLKPAPSPTTESKEREARRDGSRRRNYHVACKSAAAFNRRACGEGRRPGAALQKLAAASRVQKLLRLPGELAHIH